MQDYKVYSSKDFPSYLPKLNLLYDELFSGGKGFRAKLVNRVSGHLKLSGSSIQLLAQSIEFIHNASLLHDDLIDQSTLRRGKTAAWVKYTPEYAVLAGDYLLARVMVNLSHFGNIRLIQLTSEVISDLLEGEWIQDSLVQDWNVTLKQLDQVHNLKTASLFKWCLRAPFIAVENYNDEIHHLLIEMGSLLGQLFQRSDDLLDFNIRNDENKAILGDLKSGYLNSFGAYLVSDISIEQKNKFIVCQSLEKIYEVLSKDYFNQRLKQFDELNSSVIDLYQHQCNRLEELLPEEHRSLVGDLRTLSDILYWRKKNS